MSLFLGLLQITKIMATKDSEVPKTAIPFKRENISILAVDDTPMQLNTVKRLLTTLGYKVTTATNGREALEVLQSGQQFDLVLSDVMMPEMNGPDFLVAARSDKRFAELPIVMMSSVDQYEIVFDCLTKGADDYILKPLTPQLLKNIYVNVQTKRTKNLAAMRVQHKTRDETTIKQKITELRADFKNSTQTPINDVTSKLEKLISEGAVKPELMGQLTEALNELKTIQEAGPVPARPTPKVPAPVKSFFQAQYGVGQGKKPITPIAVTVTRKAVPPPATVPKLQSLRLGSKLLDFDFNIWDIQEKDLMNLSYDLFNLMEITKTFNAKEDELDHFISRCMQGFRTNPFHNFRRANAGLQLICAILKKAQHKLPPFEEAAVILASYLHDIDHPGTTNTFQIRTSSQLALTYNDKSVLEQNSASFGAKIIQEVFSFTLGDADFSLLRTSFINNVLKTDYTKVEKFLTKIANVPINWESAEFRALVAQVLTLMSDLSFAVRKWKQAEYWYDLMRDEQYQQGEMERRHGMKSEPNYDKRQKRSNTDIIVGHFKVFVIPIFQAGLRFFPEFETQIMSTIQLNYETITAVLEAEQEAEKMANEQKATEEKPKEN